MRIISVSGKAFNGWDFDTVLAPVTVIVGENFRGKTSRLLAINYAMCGKLPGIAESPADIYERFASGPEMETTVTMDNQSSIRRGLFRNKKGSVEGINVLNGFEKGFKSDPVLFDPAGQFLAKSDKERSQYLFRTLPPPDMSKVGPDVIVANLKNIKLEPHTPEAEQVINGLCGDVTHSFNESKMAAELVQDWLASLVEGIRLKTNAAVATAKRMKETMLGTTQLKNPDAVSLSVAEGRKQKAVATLETAVAAVNTARANYKTKRDLLRGARQLANSYVAPKEGELESLKADIDRLNTQLAGCNQNESQAWLAKVNAAKEALAKMPNPAPEELDPLWDRQRGAMRECDRTGSVLSVAQSKVLELETAIDMAKHRTTCPTCGQNTEEIQKKVIAECKARLADAKKPIKELEKTDAAARKAMADATIEVETAKKNWTEQHNAYGLASQNVATLESNHYAACIRERDALKYLNENIRGAEAKLQVLKDSASQVAPALAAAQSIPALETELATMKANGERLAETEADARKVFGEADTAHRQALADAASAQQVAKAAKEADKAQVEADVLKRLQEFLNDLLALCVEQSVKPLLDVANSLCVGVLTAPLAYKDGVIGMYRGSLFRSWRAFSGVDNVLAMAALSLGLATFTKAPVKIVFFDELGVLHASRKIVLLNRVKELVKNGTIDQCIMVDVAAEPWAGQQDEMTSVVNI